MLKSMTNPLKKDVSNKVFVEKLMKLNSTGSITISRDPIKKNVANKKFKDTNNTLDFLFVKVENNECYSLSQNTGLTNESTSCTNSTKHFQEVDVDSIKKKNSKLSTTDKKLPSICVASKVVDRENKSGTISNLNEKKISSIPCHIERSLGHLKNSKLSNRKSNINIKSKIITKKIPNFTCNLETVKNSPINIKNISNNGDTKNNTDLYDKNTVKKSSKMPVVSITRIKSSNITQNVNLTSNPSIKANITKKIPSFSCTTAKRKSLVISPAKITEKKSFIIKKSSNNSGKSLTIENIEQILTKEKDTNIYNELLDSYKYLITPKSWSVCEQLSNTNERCIVFYNACLIQENGRFTSLIKKSLIIDKETRIHYSVYGLPVDIKGTFLPSYLDSTKKLLSILHIFDKVQVCSGIGNSCETNLDNTIIKDSFRYWRHKNCKIISTKLTQCSVCTEVKNILSKSKTSFIS